MAQVNLHRKQSCPQQTSDENVAIEDDKNADKSWNWMSLPTNLTDLLKRYRHGPAHPALQMANTAISMKRSPKMAFILLLGLSGAGKSSTINYLFGSEITPKGDQKSKTQSAKEYIVEMKSHEWRIPDLCLSIIDTPGLCDTSGTLHDAKNLACIKKFLNTHSLLKNNYPNLVFIVLNISDERLAGEQSQFVKSIKYLKLLDAVDFKKPNVIVVLTHALSLPKKTWTEKVAQKTELVLNLLKEHLGVMPDIVVQENEADAWDLKKIGDWHILPNEISQPKELFKKCQFLLNSLGDEIGHEAMALCFRKSCLAKPKPGHEVLIENVTQSDIRYFEKHIYTAEHKSDSEVCKMLDAYALNNFSTDLDKEISLLKASLQRLGLNEAKDIQQYSMDGLRSRLFPLDMDMPPTIETILKEVFFLKYVQMRVQDFPIGRGYNILRDRPTILLPVCFKYAKSGKCSLPTNISVHECCSSEIRCELVENDREYIQSRLADLNISGSINFNIWPIDVTVRDGYNIIGQRERAETKERKQCSFYIEHRMYKLYLEKPFKICEEMKTDIKNLPSGFDTNDEKNCLAWKEFFDKWGHYVIIGIYLGGSFTGSVHCQESKKTNFKSFCHMVQSKLSLKMSILEKSSSLDNNGSNSTKITSSEDEQIDLSTWSIECSNDNLSTKLTSSDGEQTDISKASIQCSNGDLSLFSNSLGTLTRESLDKWDISLKHSPAALWTSLDLYPIHLLVSSVDEKKGSEMSKFFSIPEKSQCENDTRETVGKSNESGGCFHETSMVQLNWCEQKQMKDLLIGDRVLTVNKNGQIEYDTVIAWIHKDERSRHMFLNICHELGRLFISEEHILYVGKDMNSYQAFQVKIGDKIHVLLNDKHGVSCTPSTVNSIRKVPMNGLYAPLTSSGNLIVDGVVVSCYAAVRSFNIMQKEIISAHSLAHLGFLPLRLAYNLGMDINCDKYESKSGIHWYARFLMQSALPWLPGTK